jgi:transcriptional regulator with XRE-family HTH domain
VKLAKINAIAEILEAIEARREEQRLSKAEIGRRMDRRPSAVSRLLNGNDQNPTWDTLVDLAEAVGMELEVKVKKAEAEDAGACASARRLAATSETLPRRGTEISPSYPAYM